MIDHRAEAIRFEAYQSLATRGSEYIDLLESGEAFEEETLQLKSDLYKTIKILKALEFQDRLEDAEYNRLLYCLIDISKINEFPTAPILGNNKKPNISIDTVPGSDGGTGQQGIQGDAFFHVANDINLSAAVIDAVEAFGTYTDINPYTASVLIDSRTPAQQSDTPGIVGDMTRHSIHWNGTSWSDNGIWRGENGEAGDSPEMRVNGGFIQWKLSQASTWINLLATSSLIGPQGIQGIQGIQGLTGAAGLRGWSGQLLLTTRPSDGALILQLNWINGQGGQPAGQSQYLTSAGTLTNIIDFAANIKGTDAPPRLFFSSGFQNSKANISFNFGATEVNLLNRIITNSSGQSRKLKIIAWVGVAEDDNIEACMMRIRVGGVTGTELMSGFDRVDNGGRPNWQRFRLEYTDTVGNGVSRNYFFTMQQLFGGAMWRTNAYMEIFSID